MKVRLPLVARKIIRAQTNSIRLSTKGINPIIVVSAEVLQFSASRTIPISAVEIPSAIHLESSLKRCGDLEDRIKY